MKKLKKMGKEYRTEIQTDEFYIEQIRYKKRLPKSFLTKSLYKRIQLKIDNPFEVPCSFSIKKEECNKYYEIQINVPVFAKEEFANSCGGETIFICKDFEYFSKQTNSIPEKLYGNNKNNCSTETKFTIKNRLRLEYIWNEGM